MKDIIRIGMEIEEKKDSLYVEFEFNTHKVLDEILNEKEMDELKDLTGKITKIINEGIRRNVEGTLEEGIDTSDANATSDDITINKTAYVNNQKVIGSLLLFPNSRTFTVEGGISNDTENKKLKISTINSTKQILDSGVNMEFKASYADVAEIIGLTPEKLKSGETILGVTGTYTGETVES